MKLTAASAIVLALSGVVALLTWPVGFPLKNGCAYNVAVQDTQASFDLPADECPYLLVLANLTRDPTARRITLTAEPIERASADRLQRVVVTTITASAAPKSMTPPSINRRSIPSAPLPERVFVIEGQGSQRTFWLDKCGPARGASATVSIQSNLRLRSERIRVYVDQKDAVADDTLETIAQVCQSRILPTTERYLSSISDFDGDGTVAIVLTSWLDRLEASPSLGGLTRAGDFVSAGRGTQWGTRWGTQYSGSGSPSSQSNAADVVFLNANVRPGRHLETLLGHELAHAALFSARSNREPLSLVPVSQEEDWLNEGLAHVAENLHGDCWSNLDYRVQSFLGATESTSVVVPHYAQAGRWGDPATRGAAYVFLRWCVQRHGTGMMADLVRSHRCGVDNIEAATGTPFDELFRQFAVDLGTQRGPWKNVELASANLHGQMGRYSLSGPNFDRLDLKAAGQTVEVHVAGTANKYFCITAGRSGARKIRIEAESGVRLQVTLVPLGERSPGGPVTE